MLQDRRSRSRIVTKGQMQQGTQPQAAPAQETAPLDAVSKQPMQPSAVSSKGASEPNPDSKAPSARSGASESSGRVKSWTSCCPMPVTTLIPCWAGSLCMGTAMGYSLPAGRSLREAKDRGTFDITHTGIVWFGSLVTLGAVFGSLVGALLAQRYGRRWSFLTAALGLLATWLCIGLAQHVYLCYVARFVNGFFTGFVSLLVPAQIAEMALVTHRGVDAEAEVEFDAIRAIFTKYKTPVSHFMMAVLLMAVQQGSGINCIILSATSIALTPDDMNGLVVLALLQSVVSLLAVPSFDIVGRRKMVVMSVIVCSTSLVSLGYVYYSTPSAAPVTAGAAAVLVHTQNVVPLATVSTLHVPSHLAFASMAFFVAGYSVGLGPVPWILAAELTPLRYRGVELGSVCAANWATCFVTANFFATASTTQLLGVTLWLYSGVTVTGGLLFLVLLPETAHSSIEQILLIGQDVEKGRRRGSSETEPATTLKEDTAPASEPPKPPRPSSRAAAVASGTAGAAVQPLPQRSAAPGSRKSSASSRRSTASKYSGPSTRL